VLAPAHAIKAKSTAATMARRVGRVEVRAASTVRMVAPNLKAGLISSSSRVKTWAGIV
jgi:thymidine phosphorylase